MMVVFFLGGGRAEFCYELFDVLNNLLDNTFIYFNHKQKKNDKNML